MGLFGPPDIGKMKAQEDVEGLVKALDYAKDLEIRVKAVKALGEIAVIASGHVKERLRAQKGADHKPLEVDPLTNEYSKLAGRIAKALTIALGHKDAAVRTSAVADMYALGPDWIPWIAQQHMHLLVGSQPFRSSFDSLIRRFGPEAARPLIEGFFPRHAAFVRPILLAIGAPAVRPLVETIELQGRFADEPYSSDYGDAVRILAELVPGLDTESRATAVEALITACKASSHRIQSAAAQSLGGLKAAGVVFLIAALEDDNSNVRCAAAAALGKIGDRRAVEPLGAALKSKDEMLRKAAAEALARIGAPVVQALTAAVSDGDDQVRKVAAAALGRVGDTRAVQPLVLAVSDGDDQVRKVAAAALDETGWNPDNSEDGVADWTAREIPPLFVAIEKGQLDAAIQLMANGADVNSGRSGGNSPLHAASFGGHLQVVAQLIQRGANINAKITGGGDPGATPLHLAAINGNADVVLMLLKSGADANSRLGGSGQTSTSGASPLHLAATHDQSGVIEVLVENGAKLEAVDDYGDTPLHYAANIGCNDAGRVLIELGANVNAEDKYGRTPLSLAGPQSSVGTLLRQAGARR